MLIFLFKFGSYFENKYLKILSVLFIVLALNRQIKLKEMKSDYARCGRFPFCFFGGRLAMPKQG
jgi:hypothetical protein